MPIRLAFKYVRPRSRDKILDRNVRYEYMHAPYSHLVDWRNPSPTLLFLEELPVDLPVKKAVVSFFGSRNFVSITVPCFEPVEPSSPSHTSRKCILILSSHLRLGLSCLLFSGFSD